MSKEKQIEEMAKALTKYEKGLCERLPKDQCLLTSAVHAQVSCDYCKIAEFLYNAGYRKQEWISVEERLPEKNVRVLVYIKSSRSYTRFDTDRLDDRGFVRWFNDVTHWMPLPEPPKMKGGAE